MALRCITHAQWKLVTHSRWRFAVLHIPTLVVLIHFSRMRETIASRRGSTVPLERVSLRRATARCNCGSLRSPRRGESLYGASLYYSDANEIRNLPKMALRCITRAQWNLVTHSRWRFAVLHVRNEFSTRP